ncbi:hypothetical protein D9M71_284150 [compost metagenome]
MRGLGGVVGNFLGGGTELVDSGRHAVTPTGLLVRVEHRRIGSADHPLGHFVDLFCGRGHLADRTMNPFDKAVERRAEHAEFVLGVDAQSFGQIALSFGNVLHRPGHHLQWLHQEPDQQTE